MGFLFQGTTSGAVVTVTPVAASNAEQYSIDPPDAGNTGFAMSVEASGVHIPSRITLRPGGVLATGGSAALVTNSVTAIQYNAVLDYPIAQFLNMPGVSLHSAAEIQSNPGLVPTYTMSYLKMGRGAPIIVFCSESSDFKQTAASLRDLSERYTVYVPNLPYSGNIIQFPWPDTGFRSESVLQRAFISFCKLICATTGPAHMMYYSRGMATAITMMQQTPELVKSITFNGPTFTDFSGAVGGYLSDYNPSLTTQILFDTKLINDECRAIVNGTHTNPAYNAGTVAQRNLTANKLLSDWIAATATIDANRTYNDGSTIRTYLTNFRTISTSTPSAAPVQLNVDLGPQTALLLNAPAETQYVPTTSSIVQAFSNVPCLILTGYSSLPPTTQIGNLSFALGAQALAAALPSATFTIIAGGGNSPVQINTVDSYTALFNFLQPLT
jgi:hypothetical protein